jgi:hypothetical protein
VVNLVCAGVSQVFALEENANTLRPVVAGFLTAGALAKVVSWTSPGTKPCLSHKPARLVQRRRPTHVVLQQTR